MSIVIGTVYCLPAAGMTAEWIEHYSGYAWNCSIFLPQPPKASKNFTPYQGLGWYIIDEYTLEDVVAQVYVTDANDNHLQESRTCSHH